MYREWAQGQQVSETLMEIHSDSTAVITVFEAVVTVIVVFSCRVRKGRLVNNPHVWSVTFTEELKHLSCTDGGQTRWTHVVILDGDNTKWCEMFSENDGDPAVRVLLIWTDLWVNAVYSSWLTVPNVRYFVMKACCVLAECGAQREKSNPGALWWGCVCTHPCLSRPTEPCCRETKDSLKGESHPC